MTTSEQKRHQEVKRIAGTRAIREIRMAATAGFLTLLGAASIFILKPMITDALFERDAELAHPRLYHFEADGGRIEYQITGEVADREAKIARLKQDLEILSRRYMRGDFEMATLRGSRNLTEVQTLAQIPDLFSYEVNALDNGAELTIIALSPDGVEPLHGYLRYLEEFWVYQP